MVAFTHGICLMYPRVVSLILMVAVFACPLWCSKGLCCGNHQFSNERQTSDSDIGSDCCLCGLSPMETGDKQRCPCEIPIKSRCQGVCGGAVLEQSLELDGIGGSYFAPFLSVGESLGTQPVSISLLPILHHHFWSGKNYGRCVRVRHSSFLC